MVYITFIFILFLIIVSVILEIRTHQRKRVIIASSSFYALALYFVLFETFKDQFTLELLIMMRPDYLIQIAIPYVARVITYNPFNDGTIFMRILNFFGIREGTRLYSFIISYRPISADSPFVGISIKSMYSVAMRAIEDFFGWTSVDEYNKEIQQIAIGYVLIIIIEYEIKRYILLKERINVVSYQLAV